MTKKNLSKMTWGVAIGLVFSCGVLCTGCKKRDRLSVSTSVLSISPKTATLLKGQNVTLTARRVTSQGAVELLPADWTVSGSCVSGSDLNTSFGESVTFTAPTTTNNLCDATLTATYGSESATSHIAIVTYRSSATAFGIYTDEGLPTGSSLQASPNGLTISELTTGYTPEGNKYFHFVPTIPNTFWYVDLAAATDFSSFSSGKLKFSIRLEAAGGTWQVKITDTGDKTVALNSSHGFSNSTTATWQEVSVNISEFSGLNLAAVNNAFVLTQTGVTTYDVDAVRWEP